MGRGGSAALVAPTYIGAYGEFGSSADNIINWGSASPAPSSGDYCIGAVSQVGLSAAAHNFACADTNLSWLSAVEEQVPVAGRFWYGRPFSKLSTADASDTITGGVASQLFMTSWVILRGVGAGVTVLDYSALPGGTGITYASGVVTFPTYSPPTGWIYVYGVHKWATSSDGTGWSGATSRFSLSTTALNDGRVNIATVVGDDTAKPVTFSINSTDVETSGGAIAYVIAVPGA